MTIVSFLSDIFMHFFKETEFFVLMRCIRYDFLLLRFFIFFKPRWFSNETELVIGSHRLAQHCIQETGVFIVH